MENAYHIKDTQWGSLGAGPLHVSFASEETKWPAVWRDTLANRGFPVSMNPFSGQIYGGFRDPESVHPTTKLRSYAASAYLEPARSRPNLTIWTNALVDKIIFGQSSDGELSVTAVQFTKGGTTSTVKAGMEVILCAGTIQTPKILELSGVGNAEMLHSLSVDVFIDNPYVGENLQNHVYLSLSNEVFKEEGFETLDGLLQQDPAAIAAAQEALAKGKGPLTGANTSGSAQMPLPCFSSDEGKRELDQLFEKFRANAVTGKATTTFINAHESFVYSVLSSPTEASAVYSTFPGFMAFDDNGDQAPHPSGDDRYLTFAISLAHPLSRGSTHITSPSASSPGLEIDPRYLSHPMDVEVLARHIQELEMIKKTKPLAERLIPDGKRAPGGVDLSDLEQARAYVRRACNGAYHFTGTCSQMPREIGGVVDERLRVYGCKNLRVCDLSIVPIIPRCNTQALAYGIAEHGAKIIKSDLVGN